MRDDKIFQTSLDLLKNLFKQLLINNEYVYLFGSSARKDCNRYSDIDIAIGNADSKTITLLRYEVENLNIPYKVEIIDLNNTSIKIKEAVFKEGIKIWEG